MGTPGPVPPRWVVVVPRDQPDLYESLRRSLIENAPFRVILDRRERERRRGGGGGASTERRRTDRRQRAPVATLFLAGVAAVEAVPTNGAPVPPGYDASSAVVATACPACWVALSFEMPRFPKPPARLEAEVIHVGGPSAAQHYAEIQAFTISGRPLVVQRVQAVRPTPTL